MILFFDYFSYLCVWQQPRKIQLSVRQVFVYNEKFRLFARYLFIYVINHIVRR